MLLRYSGGGYGLRTLPALVRNPEFILQMRNVLGSEVANKILSTATGIDESTLDFFSYLPYANNPVKIGLNAIVDMSDIANLVDFTYGHNDLE